MRMKSLLPVAVIATGLVASTPISVHAQMSTNQDPAIVKVADAYVKASLAADAKAIAALYTDSAIEMPPNRPPIKGRAAIETYYQKEFADPAFKMTTFALTHIDTVASGDVGYDVGTYSQTMTMGGKPMNDTGKYTVILKRVAGQWKVAYAIYNSDNPPVMPPSAK